MLAAFGKKNVALFAPIERVRNYTSFVIEARPLDIAPGHHWIAADAREVRVHACVGTSGIDANDLVTHAAASFGAVGRVLSRGVHAQNRHAAEIACQRWYLDTDALTAQRRRYRYHAALQWVGNRCANFSRVRIPLIAEADSVRVSRAVAHRCHHDLGA